MKTTTVIAKHPPSDRREWDNQCARCGSSMDFVDCGTCDHGYSDHDCGEDTCCCLRPELNVPCEVCDGEGGWWSCLSSPEFCEAHPRPGRENVKRGEIEWYTLEE